MSGPHSNLALIRTRTRGCAADCTARCVPGYPTPPGGPVPGYGSVDWVGPHEYLGTRYTPNRLFKLKVCFECSIRLATSCFRSARYLVCFEVDNHCEIQTHCVNWTRSHETCIAPLRKG
eukprot:3941538-Rhodomonas_salina.2